jgi:hypothetical protein
LGSPLPDFIIGSIISALVFRGGVSIINDARLELEKEQ